MGRDVSRHHPRGHGAVRGARVGSGVRQRRRRLGLRDCDGVVLLSLRFGAPSGGATVGNGADRRALLFSGCWGGPAVWPLSANEQSLLSALSGPASTIEP